MQQIPLEIICLSMNLGIARSMLPRWCQRNVIEETQKQPTFFAHPRDFYAECRGIMSGGKPAWRGDV